MEFIFLIWLEYRVVYYSVWFMIMEKSSIFRAYDDAFAIFYLLNSP